MSQRAGQDRRDVTTRRFGKLQEAAGPGTVETQATHEGLGATIRDHSPEKPPSCPSALVLSAPPASQAAAPAALNSRG